MIDLQHSIDRLNRTTVLAIVSQTLLTATIVALVVILVRV